MFSDSLPSSRAFRHGSTSLPKARRLRGVHRGRKLQLETLETRLMLAVTLTDFNAIKAAYPDLKLTSYSNYNIIEIPADNLTDEAIRGAIAEAGTTTKNDLIVCRTTADANTITLNGDQLVINIDADTKGSITIVSLGDVPLTIDANHESRVMIIFGSSVVALGGLTITNGNGGGPRTFNSGNGAIGGISTMEPPHARYGGGIYNFGTLTVTHSTITGNTALYTSTNPVGFQYHYGGYGAGIYNWWGVLTVTNSLITNNMASGDSDVGRAGSGGGIYNGHDYGHLFVVNSTITGNTGGGIYLSSGKVTLTNSIIVNNGAADIIGSTINGYNNLTAFTEWRKSSGNVLYDPDKPLFVDAANGDYRLAPGSQAIDTGNNSRAAKSLDSAGNSRIVGKAIDIGAYEYQDPNALAKTIPAPRSVKATADGMNSINMSWAATKTLPAGLELVGYKVEIFDPKTKTYSELITTDETSYRAEGLDKGVSYTFRVTLICKPKSGDEAIPSAKPIVVKAKTATKLVALKLDKRQLGDISFTSITLHWQARPDLDSYSGQYTCTVNKIKTTVMLTEENAIWLKNADGEIIGIEIIGLNPGVRYAITITGTTSKLATKNKTLLKPVLTTLKSLI